MSEPKKTILINPDFLKLPMRGNKTRKNKENTAPKPIKIRTELDKTYKRRALNYIRKHQEEKYKRLMKGVESGTTGGGEPKTYADNFKSDFDESLEFLQKLTDQTTQKMQVHNATLKQPPVIPNSTLFHTPVLNQILDQPIAVGSPNTPTPLSLPKPTYGCLKGGTLPTYRTLKAQNILPLAHSNTAPQEPPSLVASSNLFPSSPSPSQIGGSVGNQLPLSPLTSSPQQPLTRMQPRLTPEQQRAELKQFLEKRKEEKERIELVKRQRNILNPTKKQKRTTRRTFRVGKSKHYPRVGVLIPNKTIRTQILAKKQNMREIPLQDVRKYLIQKGLIRVGSSCPNDVLRQMYESSMMMCGEIQNHNPDNLLYNYLHNGL